MSEIWRSRLVRDSSNLEDTAHTAPQKGISSYVPFLYIQFSFADVPPVPERDRRHPELPRLTQKLEIGNPRLNSARLPRVGGEERPERGAISLATVSSRERRRAVAPEVSHQVV